MKLSGEARRELDKIVKKIIQGYKPEKIILFGSYAYGEADRDSDLDLLIIKDTHDRHIDRWMDIRRLVTDPKRLVPFEPLILTPTELQERLDMGDQFFQEIMSQGIVLYAS